MIEGRGWRWYLGRKEGSELDTWNEKERDRMKRRHTSCGEASGFSVKSVWPAVSTVFCAYFSFIINCDYNLILLLINC